MAVSGDNLKRNTLQRILVDRAMPPEDGKVHNLERRKERESLSPGAALREVAGIINKFKHLQFHKF
ncbi:hypothetical protein EOD39_8563 [Acipenser ruthenus]|uniref:Uncharacterized protein n=1 Tax=Acipenser ruthenus TaxID=7906 RepID=A0A444U3J2_ACIRT|nr:hypothetical protein EOD39_8563 [Acipenser ruthenus]